MTTDPEQDPLKAANAMEAEAGQLEARAKQLRQKAAQLKNIARVQTSEENRLKELRQRERQKKQVAAIQQRAVLETPEAAQERPNFIVETFSFIFESPLLKGVLVPAMRLAFLGLVIFGFVVAYNIVSDRKNNKQQSLEKENGIVAVHFNSLEEVLEKANPRQLRYQSEIRKDDPLKSDVERIKDANSRIAIAERMLRLRLGDDEKAFANRSLAFSRLQLEEGRERYQVSTTQTRLNLKRFLRERAEDKDDRVRDIVVMGQAFLDVTDLAMFDGEKRDKDRAMEHFKSALAVAEGSSDLLMLRNTALIACRSQLSPTTIGFLEVFIDKFEESNDPKIKALVKGTRLEWEFLKRKVPAGVETTGNPIQKLLDDTRFTVEQKLSSSVLSDRECQDLVAKLTRVVQAGRAPEAKELVDKVDASFRELPSVFEIHRENVSNLKLVLSQLGETFPGFALRTPNGDQFEFDGQNVGQENPKQSFVMFVEADAVNEGYSQALKLAEKSSEQLAANKTQIVLVFLDPVTDERWIEIRQRDLPENCFWVRVDKDSDAGRRFLDQFPILWSPFWIELDDKLNIGAISPSEEMILSKIKQ